MRYALSLPLVLLAATAVACSPKPSDPKSVDVTSASKPAAAADTATPTAGPPPGTAASPGVDQARVLGLSGLGSLKIGEAVPTSGSWAAPGGQSGAECRSVRSAQYPGVYALVEGGKVRRITVGQGSDVKMVEGIGVGATEADVGKRFAGFRSEPHKYEAAPAKYLTAPNAANSVSALRFEIGADGKVKMMHVGQMPQLAYVEGCG